MRIGDTAVQTRERYHVLDGIRGAAVISMILYHAMWDVENMFDIYMPWYYSNIGYIWQQSICWTFILLSGFCWKMGRRRLKRGLIVFVAGLVVTAVTAVLMPNDIIIFGILTLIGTCMLVMIPLDKGFKHVNPIIGLILAAAAFFVTRNVNYGMLGFEDIFIKWLPYNALYKNTLTAFFGFPPYAFRSNDYFSFMPWAFLFITGYFLYGIFEVRNWLKIFTRKSIRLLEFIGRHALIIYLVHQPVLYAIAEIINFLR